MVRQGDIVRINFNPQAGHEQAGFRPALVVSNDVFNDKVNLAILCPITNTKREFPLHIELDSRTRTTGVIMCEQIKSLDIEARGYEIVEQVPDDILSKVLEYINAEFKPCQA
ncbi:MAG: type II toxin-antitoxin system PemK/MazF family toxin [Mogibacterium sp.]|mgnify:CR=1 FL=1|nr:type II toxin-antitoxin system PemK/MazF family toxin [Mogibacterium sp.]